MNVHRSARALVLLACLAPAPVRAAGYGVYEQGAAALGMAGAFVATAHDASAQFYNPAAMTWLEGARVMGGGTWLTTHTSFAGTPEYPGYGTVEEMETGSFFPPAVYGTYPFAERFTLGFGLNAPFGLGVEWEDAGQSTRRERLTKAWLETLKAAVNVAFRLNEQWSVAAGADMLNARVELNNIGTVIGDGGAPINALQVKLESDFTPGWGYHFAVSGRPSEAWRVGAVYGS